MCGSKIKTKHNCQEVRIQNKTHFRCKKLWIQNKENTFSLSKNVDQK